MPRYIDAEKANEVMLNAMCGTGYQSRAMSAIDDTPTADVEEVKHGEIIKSGRRFPYCSECKCNVSDVFYRCPWCGAKFDEKENKND